MLDIVEHWIQMFLKLFLYTNIFCCSDHLLQYCLAFYNVRFLNEVANVRRHAELKPEIYVNIL